MPGKPHLLLAISPHGYGHAVQSAPVINRLCRLRPELRLTLRTTLPRSFLESRFEGAFEIQHAADDFGMLQRDALTVDVAASAAAYRRLHADWPARRAQVVTELMRAGPDLVLADVPYLTLAAAAEAGIPSLAMCCLNWADIYWHYCRHQAGSERIHRDIVSAYQSADLFLRSEPAMPMPGLGNLHTVGPLVEPGRNRREALLARLGLKHGIKLVLVGMGGFSLDLNPGAWPRLSGVQWLVPAAMGLPREDFSALEDTGLSFSELLASSDLFITKPGYGSFTEAAANGVPVLYVLRPGWPEAPYLVEWLAAHAHSDALEQQCFMKGEFAEQVEALLAAGRYEPVPGSGVEETALLVAGRLP